MKLKILKKKLNQYQENNVKFFGFAHCKSKILMYKFLEKLIHIIIPSFENINDILSKKISTQ
jgi:hypothetical protein